MKKIYNINKLEKRKFNTIFYVEVEIIFQFYIYYIK